jgi:hypothetical protein
MGIVIERLERPIPQRVGLFLLLGVLLAGCGGSAATSSAGPTAWIDAPLDGSQIPVGDITIVMHAASPDGVQSVALSVDGQLLDELSAQNPEDHIIHLDTSWSPPGPGQYLLEAVAVDGGGHAGPPADALVSVRGTELTVTPTPAASATATATPTTAPTPTPTPTSIGVSVVQVSLSDHQIYWGGSCQPDSVTVGLRVSAPEQVTSAVFFYRVEDARSHEMSDWSQGAAMNPQGAGEYSLVQRGTGLAQGTGYPVAIVHYQFALQTRGGGIVRSDVFRDLSLSECGSGPGPTPGSTLIFPPPMVTIQPTKPPIIQ